ncbi:unnamed protein product [Darwinula stevensoni]|uniref:Sorting nexin-13 n=1 Tax=Darwinula stevensoni TaxID=69355 RepID=A0A7R9A072_9CRUS|nr:unnamed protein product [Darwinula stevensoni]CAG0880415.1 unnamed protein product [Darwinula stevensoni]
MYNVDVLRSRLDIPDDGVLKLVRVIQEPKKSEKKDKRLTGSYIIDEPLRDIIQYTIRDYVQTWYHHISPDTEFPEALESLAQKVIIALANRSKEVDWIPYLTKRFVDDIATHLRLFKQSRQAHIASKGERELTEHFFDHEFLLEKCLCRDLICTREEVEQQYLREISEVLLYLTLPPEDFPCKTLRFLLRELLVSAILLPTVRLLSDPDYLNQIIIWLCKAVPITNEAFLTAMRMTDRCDELAAVLEKVNSETSLLRSQDSGGEADAEIKQQLSSLSYVKRLLESRIHRLREGGVNQDGYSLPYGCDWNRYLHGGVRLVSLSLDTLLKNNIALTCFIEFLHTMSAQHYIFLYLNIEGWKVSAEQVIQEVDLACLQGGDAKKPKVDRASELEKMRQPALQIYHQYLSDKASPKVKLDDTLVRQLYQKLQCEVPRETWFDGIQHILKEKLADEPFLPSFRRSPNYIKLLAELDLLKDGCRSDEEDSASLEELSLSDTGSIASGGTPEDALSIEDKDLTHSFVPVMSPPLIHEGAPSLQVEITNYTVVLDSPKPYALYEVTVKKVEPQGNGQMQELVWRIFRRYSDFYDFHQVVVEKMKVILEYVDVPFQFPSLNALYFPAKKTFNNLKRNFLRTRLLELNRYLQTLASKEFQKAHPGLSDRLIQFLEGSYEQRGMVERMVIMPLKHGVKTMGQAITAVPGTVLQTVDDMVEGINKVFSRPSKGPAALAQDMRVAASLEHHDEETIPLRILLLVFNEVFDMRNQEAWLRKRLVAVAHHLVNVMFGDIYNRRILEFIDWATSSEQVALYLKNFRNSFWPNGSLALPAPPRDKNTKLRTQIAAKAFLFSVIPVLYLNPLDELKRVLGNDTARRGMLSVYDMFQHPTLNKRLVYLILEGLLVTVFPRNQFHKLFTEFHHQSPRVSTKASTRSPGVTRKR